MTDLKTNNEIFTDLNTLTIEELTKLFNTDYNQYNNLLNEIFKLEEEKREIKNKVYIDENKKLIINKDKLKIEDLKYYNYINNIDEFISQAKKIKNEAEEIKKEYNKKIKSLKNLKNYNIYKYLYNYDLKEF